MPENEDIIDLRYPFFRSQVSAFINSDILTSLHEDAAAKLMRDAATSGATSSNSVSCPARSWDANRPVVDIEVREGVLVAVCRFFGVNCKIATASSDTLVKEIIDFFGHEPTLLHIGEPVIAADAVAASLSGLGRSFEHTVGYPTRV